MNPQKQMGKRRQLIQSILYKQAIEDITDNQEHNYDNAAYQSEYQKTFCDVTFTPTLDNNELLYQREAKYPLNSSLARTIYTQQVMERILKVNSPSLNLKEPFRKNNIITDNVRTTIKEIN